MNNIALIQLHEIYKTFISGQIKFEALKNINLNINKGEYVAILGPSGSGKSTLMQIMGCLLTPTMGSFRFLGKEVSNLTRKQLAKIRNMSIGFVFQSFNLLPQLTALDNVALPLVYQGVTSKERLERAEAILERVGLATHITHRPNELSGGQQQRVAIARALVTNPEIILADEPTGNLDSKSGVEIIGIFAELIKQGKTIILVTHDLKMAEYSKRIIRIHDGRVVDE